MTKTISCICLLLFAFQLVANSQDTCAATTAMGVGDDAAIFLLDFDGDPDDDGYFVPTDAGMSLIQFENGGVFVSGQVVDIDDPISFSLRFLQLH